MAPWSGCGIKGANRATLAYLNNGRWRRLGRFDGTLSARPPNRERGIGERRGRIQMRRLRVMGLLLLVAPMSASRQAVTVIELEYVDRFLTPAMAYGLLPRCPQPANTACSDSATVAALRDTQIKLHDTIIALRNFSDASPQADATVLIARAREELSAGETLIPAKSLAP
jgi:hypothetical protein